MKKFDDDLEFESLNDEPRDTRFILPIIVVAVLLVIVIVALVLLGKNKDTSADLMSTEQSETTETETQTTEVMGNIARKDRDRKKTEYRLWGRKSARTKRAQREGPVLHRPLPLQQQGRFFHLFFRYICRKFPAEPGADC